MDHMLFMRSILLQLQFIEKNNDALHMSLESLVLESKNPLVKAIFSSNDKANGVNNRGSKAGKLTFISVGSKFRGQLTILLDKLKSTVSSTFCPQITQFVCAVVHACTLC